VRGWATQSEPVSQLQTVPMWCSPPEDQVESPAVPTSVTAGADNPRRLPSPSDVFIGERGRGLFRASPPPASALVLANPALAVLPRAAVLLHPFECHCHPSVGFRCPSGHSPEDRPPCFTACSADSARPLSWGSAPSSGHERKGSGFYPGTPTSPAVASSGFEPSRRLDPLHAFPTFLPGPLLGLLPSGLFSSRRSEPTFVNPYPPGIA
jgi:hypothetical protein